jgi:hypothetical protein
VTALSPLGMVIPPVNVDSELDREGGTLKKGQEKCPKPA